MSCQHLKYFAFSAIKERVGTKLHEWKEKFLSQVGKKVLLEV
jgi:hypothetical protein